MQRYVIALKPSEAKGKTLGLRPKPCLAPSWKKGLRTPRTFTEKGIPPAEVPNRLYVPLVGGMPFSVKFFGFLNLSSKKGLGGVWGGAPRSYFFPVSAFRAAVTRMMSPMTRKIPSIPLPIVGSPRTKAEGSNERKRMTGTS